MTTDLAVFDKVKAEIETYKKLNKEMNFDYEDPAGNKLARSHVHKLRGVKTTITTVHKEAKADALAACKAIDAEKRTYMAEVEEMIEVHDKPLKEIEDRKIAEAFARAEEIRIAREAEEERKQKEMEERQAKLDEREAAQKAEAEKFERAREKFEAEKIAEANAKAREEEVRKQAKIDAKEAAEQAERDRVAAAKKAKQDKLDAIEAEKRKAIREAEAKEQARLDKEADDKAEKEYLEEKERERIADKEHRSKIETEIYHFFLSHVFIDSAVNATKAMQAIRNGKIPHVTINY